MARKSAHAPRGKSGLLAECACEVWGGGYVVPLAHLCHVNRKTVRRWLDGVHPIPAGVWLKVRDEIDKKGARMKMLSLAANGRYIIDGARQQSVTIDEFRKAHQS